MIDHLSIQCSDVDASARFYDAVLAPLGGRRIIEFGKVIGYGTTSKRSATSLPDRATLGRSSRWVGQARLGSSGSAERWTFPSISCRIRGCGQSMARWAGTVGAMPSRLGRIAAGG